MIVIYTDTYFSFLLTIIAGFSTLIGALIIFIPKRNHDNIIVSALSFASGVMICMSIFDLIPESINMFRGEFTSSSIILLCVLGLLFGGVTSMLIDFYLPRKYNSDKLYKVGIISMIAIIMHNIPEGIATFITACDNNVLGVRLASSIALHNIPEGISIALPIYYASKSKKKAFLYTFISAISEPFGAVLAFVFLKNIINDTMLGILYSVVAGIMINISLFELIPTSYKYKKYLRFIVYFILGNIFMLLKFAI